MSVTLNGWTAQPRLAFPLATATVPGTTKRVTLDHRFLPIALAALVDINAKVVPLSTGPLDGWEYREARTGAGISNHASGTAFDFHYYTTDPRWPAFPADHKQHMNASQIRAMHAILDKYRTSGGKRVLGWGGDWQVGKYCDPMHVEVAQSWSPGVGSRVTPADLANVIARLRLRSDGTSSTPAGGGGGVTTGVGAKPPTPTPAPTGAVLRVGSKGPQVEALLVGLGIRDEYTPEVAVLVDRFVRAHPELLPADGTCGPRTFKAITGRTLSGGPLRVGFKGGQPGLVRLHLGLADGYTSEVAAHVDAFVRKHPELLPADGTCGPATYRAITGKNL